jgi:hypothetical protein
MGDAWGKVQRFIEEHPWGVAIAVFVVGLLVIYYFYGGSSTTTSKSTGTGSTVTYPTSSGNSTTTDQKATNTVAGTNAYDVQIAQAEYDYYAKDSDNNVIVEASHDWRDQTVALQESASNQGVALQEASAFYSGNLTGGWVDPKGWVNQNTISSNDNNTKKTGSKY